MKNTAIKNRSSASLAVVMMTLSALLFCGTADAASKSASFQTSCTILPVMELGSSSLAKKSWEARSNLGKEQFQMSDSLVQRGTQKTRLYSLTAL